MQDVPPGGEKGENQKATVVISYQLKNFGP
jgi:hypothetical protein